MGKRAKRKPVSLSRPELASLVPNVSRIDPRIPKDLSDRHQRLTEATTPGPLTHIPEIVRSEGGKQVSLCADAEAQFNTRYGLYNPGSVSPQCFQMKTPNMAIRSVEKRSEEVVGGKEHILLVDDEEILAIMVETMLRRLGYGVTATTSSAEALRLFKQDPSMFDLVITDHTMPHLTGLGLAKKLLAIRPDVPIILCTGFSESLSEETVKRAGIREFVQKPLIRREMAAAIRQVLDETA